MKSIAPWAMSVELGRKIRKATRPENWCKAGGVVPPIPPAEVNAIKKFEQRGGEQKEKITGQKRARRYLSWAYLGEKARGAWGMGTEELRQIFG